MAKEEKKKKKTTAQQDEEVEEIEDEDEEENDEDEPADEPVATGNTIFVNNEKHNRAKDILALVSGKRAVRNNQELERKEHYSGLLQADGVKHSDKDALQYVYETLLGGLVRTPVEQKKATEKADAQRKKFKKKKITEGTE